MQRNRVTASCAFWFPLAYALEAMALSLQLITSNSFGVVPVLLI
jgi:hypothetical protein